MDTKDLNEQVLAIIENVYNCKYIGKLETSEITDDDFFQPKVIGYKVNIYLNKPETPISLSYMGSKEQFLDFVKSEIKNSRYDFVDYFNAERIYFSVGCCGELK